MSDFVSEFWNIWITVIVLGGLIWLTYLVFSQSKIKVQRANRLRSPATCGTATSPSTTIRCRAGGC